MQTLVEQIVYISDMFGTAVFAFSGVLVAGRLRMDGFGVMVLAAVTAIGGGTIRDMILGATPVFWVRDPLYIWVVIATALIGMWMVKLPRRMPWYVLPVIGAALDGCGVHDSGICPSPANNPLVASSPIQPAPGT